MPERGETGENAPARALRIHRQAVQTVVWSLRGRSPAGFVRKNKTEYGDHPAEDRQQSRGIFNARRLDARAQKKTGFCGAGESRIRKAGGLGFGNPRYRRLGSPMPLGFQHAIFIEMVDFIEETSVFVPFGKGGIESLREEITPALSRRSQFHPLVPHPAFGHPLPCPRERETALPPGERGNRRPTQCRPRRPVIGRAQTQAKATFGASGFMRISGANRVRNPSGIGLGSLRYKKPPATSGCTRSGVKFDFSPRQLDGVGFMRVRVYQFQPHLGANRSADEVNTFFKLSSPGRNIVNAAHHQALGDSSLRRRRMRDNLHDDRRICFFSQAKLEAHADDFPNGVGGGGRAHQHRFSAGGGGAPLNAFDRDGDRHRRQQQPAHHCRSRFSPGPCHALP